MSRGLLRPDRWIEQARAAYKTADDDPLKEDACDCRLGLNLHSMQLNEMTQELEAPLPPMDARRRLDMRALERGDYMQVLMCLTKYALRYGASAPA